MAGKYNDTPKGIDKRSKVKKAEPKIRIDWSGFDDEYHDVAQLFQRNSQKTVLEVIRELNDEAAQTSLKRWVPFLFTSMEGCDSVEYARDTIYTALEIVEDLALEHDAITRHCSDFEFIQQKPTKKPERAVKKKPVKTPPVKTVAKKKKEPATPTKRAVKK